MLRCVFLNRALLRRKFCAILICNAAMCFSAPLLAVEISEPRYPAVFCDGNHNYPLSHLSPGGSACWLLSLYRVIMQFAMVSPRCRGCHAMVFDSDINVFTGSDHFVILSVQRQALLRRFAINSQTDDQPMLNMLSRHSENLGTSAHSHHLTISPVSVSMVDTSTQFPDGSGCSNVLIMSFSFLPWWAIC